MKTFRVFILPIAKSGIQDGFDWYESRQRGLGDEFIYELEKMGENFTNFPFKHKVIKNDIRVAKMKRFAYLVYYEVV